MLLDIILDACYNRLIFSNKYARMPMNIGTRVNTFCLLHATSARCVNVVYNIPVLSK